MTRGEKGGITLPKSVGLFRKVGWWEVTRVVKDEFTHVWIRYVPT